MVLQRREKLLYLGTWEDQQENRLVLTTTALHIKDKFASVMSYRPLSVASNTVGPITTSCFSVALGISPTMKYFSDHEKCWYFGVWWNTTTRCGKPNYNHPNWKVKINIWILFKVVVFQIKHQIFHVGLKLTCNNPEHFWEEKQLFFWGGKKGINQVSDINTHITPNLVTCKIIIF